MAVSCGCGAFSWITQVRAPQFSPQSLQIWLCDTVKTVTESTCFVAGIAFPRVIERPCKELRFHAQNACTASCHSEQVSSPYLYLIIFTFRVTFRAREGWKQCPALEGHPVFSHSFAPAEPLNWSSCSIMQHGGAHLGAVGIKWSKTWYILSESTVARFFFNLLNPFSYWAQANCRESNLKV